MRPETLWWLSCRLHRRRLTPLARLLKALNFLLFHAVLPYECDVPRDVTLWHHGLGTVVHPNTRIGHRVKIGHNVTITAGSQSPGSELAVSLGTTSSSARGLSSGHGAGTGSWSATGRRSARTPSSCGTSRRVP